MTQGPFVTVHCSTVPEHLHELVEADGGTLFLDELAELPLALQPKLLRALQERVVQGEGGAMVPFGARIIAASDRELRDLVIAKQFREDLYFHLDVLPLRVPPLRARQGDLLLLAQHFLARSAAAAGKAITGLSPAVEQAFTSYPWPGNVRELQSCIERAVALATGDRVTTELLPKRLRAFRSPAQNGEDDRPELMTLDEVDRRHVARILAQVGGNKSEAARLLGVPRKSLYRMLARWGEGPRRRAS